MSKKIGEEMENQEKLEEMGIKFEYREFIKDTIRHKIQLVDSGIEQNIEEIKEKSKNKKG